jgi:hypothetical protein
MLIKLYYTFSMASLVETVSKDFYSGERRYQLHKSKTPDELKEQYQDYLTEKKIVDAPEFEAVMAFLAFSIKVLRLKEKKEVLWQFLLPYERFPEKEDDVFKHTLVNAVYTLDNIHKKSKHGAAINTLNLLSKHDKTIQETVSNFIKDAYNDRQTADRKDNKLKLIEYIENLKW